MNILFAGNVGKLTDSLISPVLKEHGCVVSGEAPYLSEQKRLDFYRDGGGKKEDMFLSYQFEMIVFLSKSIDGEKLMGEVEELEDSIRLAQKYHTRDFVYITSNDIFTNGENDRTRKVLMEACEKICAGSASPDDMHVQILRVPFLYSTEKNDWLLTGWLKQAAADEEVIFYADADQDTDFLCDADLGELLARIADAPPRTDYVEMNLTGGWKVTFEEVRDALVERQGNVTCVFDPYAGIAPCYRGDLKAREEYGWYALRVMVNDLPQIMEKVGEKRIRQVEQERRRATWEKVSGKMRIAVEMIVLAIVAQYLAHLTKGNVTVGFLDFRLLAVLIMGTMNGLKAGIMAGVLACIGYLLDIHESVNWQIILLNVQNWLPFAAYLLLGAVSGYSRDRLEDRIRHMKDEYGIMEDKYVYLSNLYWEVLRRAETYNNQIIGYQDSYGKIYSAIRRLDQDNPQEVFFEAVNVLEEMLQNRAIAIYSIEPGRDFARLMVCSKGIARELAKSMDLLKFPELRESAGNGQLFVNRECKEGYPSYAIPIRHEEKCYGLIEVVQAGDSQMNIEFSNKLSILSNLVTSHLLHAIRDSAAENKYIENTNILLADAFAKILEVRRNMRDKEYADYALLKILRGEDSLEEIDKKMSGTTRSSDFLGLDENGEVYLLLTQTGTKGVELVGERLKKHGISYEIVTEQGEKK